MKIIEFCSLAQFSSIPQSGRVFSVSFRGGLVAKREAFPPSMAAAFSSAGEGIPTTPTGKRIDDFAARLLLIQV